MRCDLEIRKGKGMLFVVFCLPVLLLTREMPRFSWVVWILIHLLCAVMAIIVVSVVCQFAVVTNQMSPEAAVWRALLIGGGSEVVAAVLHGFYAIAAWISQDGRTNQSA
jgi:hypothetical protein